MDKIFKFITERKLAGSGVGYVDAHLLAAAALASETFVWTSDKQLKIVVRSVSLAAEIEGRDQ